MCNIGTAELPTLYTELTPRARKEHICCECGSQIAAGEKYEVVKGLWDGSFDTFKTCMFCAEIRKNAYSVLDLTLDEGIVFGELWECVGYDFTGE